MFYYAFDKWSVVTAKLTAPPESGDYCTSDMDFDLDLYTVYVGTVSTDRQLTYYTQKAKTTEQLAQQIITMHQSQLDTDTAALDLDYRLTLLENGAKAGED